MDHIVLVVGLGFGDEGKGSSVDFLTRYSGSSLVVRYNGGAQAGHRVMTSSGKSHVFSQFGSGTLAGADTFLSRFMMVNPKMFLIEDQELQNLGYKPMVSVEREALVTTPFHIAANRWLERQRRAEGHGTCGMGIGETMSDFVSGKESMFVQDLQDTGVLKKKLARIQERKRDEVLAIGAKPSNEDLVDWSFLDRTDLLDLIVEDQLPFLQRVHVVDRTFLSQQVRRRTVIFEGAQGVLLDQSFGFHPHTTWSDCTFGNALKLLQDLPTPPKVQRLGILRAYSTRHGMGPFVAEDAGYDTCSDHDYNKTGSATSSWQGRFRSGPFDFIMARYALGVIGHLDGLILTHLDRLGRAPNGKAEAITSYQNDLDGEVSSLLVNPAPEEDLVYQAYLTDLLQKSRPYGRIGMPTDLVLAEMLKIPLAVTSFGPTANDKVIHRL